MATEQVISVPDMSCSHCEATVTQAVRSVAGVVDVQVDLESKKVTVKFDESKTSLEAIKQAIAESGYERGVSRRFLTSGSR